MSLRVVSGIFLFGLLTLASQPGRAEEIAKSKTRLPSAGRLGLGLQAGGTNPGLGLNLEMKFTEQVSLLTGYGLSENLQSLALGARLSPWLGAIRPNFGGGYALWQPRRQGRPLVETSPTFVSDRFLSPQQLARGEFREHLAYLALGLQVFPSRHGTWSQASFQLEAVLLGDVVDFKVAPQLGAGLTQYF